LLAAAIGEKAGLGHDEANELATLVLKPLGIQPGKKESDTAYLLFLGRAQIDHIAEIVSGQASALLAMSEGDREKEVQGLAADQLMTAHPLDVALFGRMVADLPRINVDASTQVAHAISTHPVEIEFDYFTAVDDEKERNEGEDAGAAMIGTVEFNSATLYRYATVAMHCLASNLDDDEDAAAEAAIRFVEAFVKSMPTGKQNSFAHRTLPEAVVVVLREDQPVNLVSAFEQPVSSRDGYSLASVAKLAKALREADDRWGERSSLVVASYRDGDGLPGIETAFGPSLPFTELMGTLGTSLKHNAEVPA
jgi:CRISPR system Cascade subunit CasC